MKTLLLPTTLGVNEGISIKEALNILKSNGMNFKVAGNVVDGMYLAESGEIVAEQLLPITSKTLRADTLAVMFTQECILESTDKEAKLVAQNGDIWANFNKKVEYNVSNMEENEVIKLQTKMTKHFGGASRQGNVVWAWGDDKMVSNW